MTTCLGNCRSPGCRLWCLCWCLFVLSFFPRGVLDEILNLIESVSEDFPSYSSIDWMCWGSWVRMGQGARTCLGHGGITCVLQTQFSSLFQKFYTDKITRSWCRLSDVWFVTCSLFVISDILFWVCHCMFHTLLLSEVPSSIPSPTTYFHFSFRWFKKGSC